MRVLFIATFVLVGLTLTSSKPVLPALPIVPMLEFAKSGISTLITISKMMPKSGGSNDEGGGSGIASLFGLGKKPSDSSSGDNSGGGVGGIASMLGFGKKDGGGGGGGGGLSSLLGLDKSPLSNIFKPSSNKK